MYQNFFKRLLDIVLSVCALIVLSPILLAMAFMVRSKLGSPVIFCQERVGKNEKVFRLYKFRSMTSEVDAFGNLLPDEQRLTNFGRLLRSTSLDELPELWNILKGDMSIVGPRPLLVQYLPYYSTEERCRHDVRPGLTGLAQVTGRSFLSWDEIFSLDLSYVTHISFRNDCRIILQTIKKVLTRQDIADVNVVIQNEAGEIMVRDGEILRPLHRPLNIERGEKVCSAK